MYLKEIRMPIPYDECKIVIRNQKTVQMELNRTYSTETKDSRVERKTIGQVAPMYPGMMYPNEHYFALVPNEVPEEIREPFLRKCARRREIAELKKNPEAMMNQVAYGIQHLKAQGGGEPAEENEEKKPEKVWYIRSEHDLEYALNVFGDLYDLMEAYATRKPHAVLEPYKVRMFNKILAELKLTLRRIEPLQSLKFIPEPTEETDEKGNTTTSGLTNSDVLMLLTWYKNAVQKY